MKRLFSGVLVIVLLFCGSIGLIPAQAADALSGTCGVDLTWTLENGTLTISGTGNMQSYQAYNMGYFPESVPPIAPWFDARDDIRSVVIREGITSIGNGAFGYCENLQTVTLPQTLTRIGTGAFYDCRSLDNVQIPRSVTDISRCVFIRCGKVFVDADNPAYAGGEDGLLYSKDRTELLHYPANHPQTSFSIPESVRKVEEFAFEGCEFLKTLTVPKTLESAAYAFFCCLSLQSVIVEEGVKVIERNMFYGCRNLRSVTLPDGLEAIEAFAFCYTALEYLHIPSSVTQIDPFYDNAEDLFSDKNALRNDLPYMRRFYICSDSADCAAAEFAEENQYRFYVCNGKHSDQTARLHNSVASCLLYVLRDDARMTKLLSALIKKLGTVLKSFPGPQGAAG